MIIIILFYRQEVGAYRYRVSFSHSHKDDRWQSQSVNFGSLLQSHPISCSSLRDKLQIYVRFYL